MLGRDDLVKCEQNVYGSVDGLIEAAGIEGRAQGIVEHDKLYLVFQSV